VQGLDFALAGKPVWVIPAEEERQIAVEALALMAGAA